MRKSAEKAKHTYRRLIALIRTPSADPCFHFIHPSGARFIRARWPPLLNPGIAIIEHVNVWLRALWRISLSAFAKAFFCNSLFSPFICPRVFPVAKFLFIKPFLSSQFRVWAVPRKRLYLSRKANSDSIVIFPIAATYEQTNRIKQSWGQILNVTSGETRCALFFSPRTTFPLTREYNI